MLVFSPLRAGYSPIKVGQDSLMKRREFITLLGSAAVIRPGIARAQQSTVVQRVGVLSDESHSLGSTVVELIAKTLHGLGYVEGRNIIFESRYADGKDNLLAGLVAELIRIRVSLIIAVGAPATRAARDATDTIPIVFSRIADPLALGLVTSLARPGGNLTGVSVNTQDLAAKRLEMLADLIPGIKRVGVLWDPTFPSAPLELKEIESAARVLNIEIQPSAARSVEELEAAVRAVVGQRGEALFVVPGLIFTEQRQLVAEIAIRSRLPTMLSRREQVEAGGLMSYGTNYSDMYRLAATYVDKILKGAKPSDLPVEQPTKFELAINLKTAMAVGITFPMTIQARADQVIE
jgi:putative ABC transport system substrate-binding protein